MRQIKFPAERKQIAWNKKNQHKNKTSGHSGHNPSLTKFEIFDILTKKASNKYHFNRMPFKVLPIWGKVHYNHDFHAYCEPVFDIFML